MSGTPSFLAGVEWKPSFDTGADADGLPYITHSGVLNICGKKLRCYRLSNEQAIFNVDDFAAFFAALGE